MFELSTLSQPKNFRAKRVSKYGYMIQPDGVEVLADVDGPGEIVHIWLIVDCNTEHFLRKFLVRMYWDNEKQPSVEAPLGDLFGVGHARNTPYECAVMNVISSHDHPYSPTGHGFVANMYYPMPFADNARIELIADSVPTDLKYAFYFHLDYRQLKEPSSELRFHSQWRRENPTTGLPGNREDCPEENYVLLEAAGHGNFAGANLSIHSLGEGWWCEGSEMIFVDGESYPPAVNGIGVEDYAGHGWGTHKQANLYAGCSVYDDDFDPSAGQWRSKWTIYRHHVLDPIPFRESIRATIEHGHANSRSDDYSSTVYWYQTEPHQVFPEIPPAQQRLPRPTNESPEQSQSP